VKLLAQTPDAIVIHWPRPTKQHPQHLCVDKGYRGKAADQQMRTRGYIPHVPSKTPPKGGHKTRGRARRWVVERTHSWMNNYRKLRVRYEKKGRQLRGVAAPSHGDHLLENVKKTTKLYLRISSKIKRRHPKK
jgi:transposase